MLEKTPSPKPKDDSPIDETLEQAKARAAIKNLGYLISQSSTETPKKDQPPST